MPTVSRGLAKWVFHRSATLEDFADRLNHFWTVGLLLLFAAIISWRQTYINPILCWTPGEFTTEWTLYAADQCWNRYYIIYEADRREAEEEIYEMFNTTEPFYSFRVPTPRAYVVSEKPNIETSSLFNVMATTRTLYQWLPLILCLQALLFKLPNILMYVLHGLSGISFDKIGGLTRGFENMNLQERSILCRQIARYIHNWCKQCKNCLPWRQLTILWFVVKCLYCVNVVVQISLIDGILTPENTTSFGDVIATNLFENNATLWKDALAFPKQIFCDFSITQFMNIHQYTIQCGIPANHFNQFAYMFIWVWLVFVAVVTVTSLFVWLVKTLFPVSRKRYVTQALSLADELDVNTISPFDLGKFCDVIGEDGVLALKLAGSNSSDLLVGEIVRNLWGYHADRSGHPGGGEILSASIVHVQPSAPGPIYPSLPASGETSTEKKME